MFFELFLLNYQFVKKYNTLFVKDQEISSILLVQYILYIYICVCVCVCDGIETNSSHVSSHPFSNSSWEKRCTAHVRALVLSATSASSLRLNTLSNVSAYVSVDVAWKPTMGKQAYATSELRIRTCWLAVEGYNDVVQWST